MDPHTEAISDAARICGIPRDLIHLEALRDWEPEQLRMLIAVTAEDLGVHGTMLWSAGCDAQNDDAHNEGPALLLMLHGEQLSLRMSIIHEAAQLLRAQLDPDARH